MEAIEHSENVATTYAVEAITEQAQCAKNAAQGVDGDQANDLSRKTTGNFVIQTLRSAYALLRTETGFALREYRAGVYRTAGAATAGGVGFVAYSNWPAILSFVAKNADALREFARHNPTVVEIINAIARRCLNVAPL